MQPKRGNLLIVALAAITFLLGALYVNLLFQSGSTQKYLEISMSDLQQENGFLRDIVLATSAVSDQKRMAEVLKEKHPGALIKIRGSVLWVDSTGIEFSDGRIVAIRDFPDGYDEPSEKPIGPRTETD